jgi:arabinan endo-1,5-alpha-L-arabinosidase
VRQLVLGMLLAGAALAAAAEDRPMYTNPVILPVAADPTIARGPDGLFYLYATQDNWSDGKPDHLVPLFTSADLVHWEWRSDAFGLPPAWKQGGGGLWAPDITFFNGAWHLYYAYSKWGDPDPGIGVATAASPAGPWTDLGRPVLMSSTSGVENSIDPEVWVEGAVKTLLWGSFHGIYAAPLSADGTRLAGDKVMVADKRFEAPLLTKHDGFYYLFLSLGSCCEGARSTYTLYVGRSKAVTGPYVDSSGRNLLYGGGEVVIYRNDTWVGPGHATLVADDAGTDWLLYHAMPAKDATLPNGTNRRQGLLDPITWVDGWPVVNDGDGPGWQPAPAPVVKRK